MGSANLHAQATAPVSAEATSAGLEQILVTARRREEKQQDVPLAVTALSGDFLAQNAVMKITDLNGKVPSLRIDSFNSPSYTNVGIRAQRSPNVAPGQDSAVGYYFDEVNYGFPVGINQQMFDLQSVEVVKGPQGTLFGRNTTGGALLVTSARPEQEFSGSATGGVTTFDSGAGYSATGVVNLPVGDHLQLRAAVNTIQREGYVENLISKELLAAYEVTPWLGVTDRDPMNEEKSTRLASVDAVAAERVGGESVRLPGQPPARQRQRIHADGTQSARLYQLRDWRRRRRSLRASTGPNNDETSGPWSRAPTCTTTSTPARS